MDRLAFTATATVSDQGVSRQVIANELVNVNTIGFKRTFDNALQAVKVQGQGFDTRYQTRDVDGSNIINLAPGAIMATGQPLDVAMENQTVLMVRAENGELAFTRRGDLRMNTQGVLETAKGEVVVGRNGPISAPPGLHLKITPDGSLYASDPARPGRPPIFVDQLQLRDASQVTLLRRPDALFAVQGQPFGSDFPTGPVKPSLVPQALEGSNVNPIYVMTRMMDQSRSFESQMRMVKEAKSLDESGSTLLKMV